MNKYEKLYYEEAKKAYAALMLCYPFGLEDLDGEIWADIAGYDGDYQESNYGRTKSFKGNSPKILAPMITSKGYLGVQLFKNAKGKKIYVHQLVASIFVPNPENKTEINHLDGFKLNNHVDNLEWVCSTDNKLHAVKIGLMKSGSEHVLAKLTAEQVRYIRQVYIKGDSEFGGQALAKKFCVSRSTIQSVVNYECYKNIE